MEHITNLFKGRINRRNLLLGWTLSVSIVFGFLALAASVSDTYIGGLFGTIYIFLFIAAIIFGISLQVRRWHDLGDGGLMVVLSFIPLVNIYAFFSMILRKGQKGENKYGKEPRDNVKFPQDVLALN